MGPGEISRHLPGQCEEPYPDEARRRQDRRGREAQETRSSCGFDVSTETKPGPDGRQEKTGCACRIRRTKTLPRRGIRTAVSHQHSAFRPAEVLVQLDQPHAASATLSIEQSLLPSKAVAEG